jgi:hypothetical protein
MENDKMENEILEYLYYIKKSVEYLKGPNISYGEFRENYTEVQPELNILNKLDDINDEMDKLVRLKSKHYAYKRGKRHSKKH